MAITSDPEVCKRLARFILEREERRAQLSQSFWGRAVLAGEIIRERTKRWALEAEASRVAGQHQRAQTNAQTQRRARAQKRARRYS